jgi:hypothetical protein
MAKYLLLKHYRGADGLLSLLAGRTASLDRHEPEDPGSPG